VIPCPSLKLIGLVGRKQHGKDTVYKLIERNTTLRVKRFAFADPLKYELAAACNVTVQEIEGNKERFRLGLQWWGTEFRRGKNPEYWVNQLRQALIDELDFGDAELAVITDCRFRNEAEMVREQGGILVRVVRPGFTMGDHHASEAEVDQITTDHTIMNDSDIVALEYQAKGFLGSLDMFLAERCNA
jgi:hypothetical protein